MAVYNITDILINSPLVIFSGLKNAITNLVQKILCFLYPSGNCQFLAQYLLNCYQCLSIYVSILVLLIYFIPNIGKFIIYVFAFSFIVNILSKFVNKKGEA